VFNEYVKRIAYLERFYQQKIECSLLFIYVPSITRLILFSVILAAVLRSGLGAKPDLESVLCLFPPSAGRSPLKQRGTQRRNNAFQRTS